MEMNRPRAAAFTLIELLVVITIIAVLMGLAFPVFQSIQNQAKKTQAKNDLTQIVTAVNAFYTEYGKYPVPTGTTDDGYSVGGGGPSSQTLFLVLRGKEPTLNPRSIEFISPPDARDPSKPRAGIGPLSDSQFFDPWGSPYAIRIDADYDNEVPNPYGADKGAGPANIRQGVISWSLGKNGILGGGNATDANF